LQENVVGWYGLEIIGYTDYVFRNGS
jgi:hypothetical protein